MISLALDEGDAAEVLLVGLWLPGSESIARWINRLATKVGLTSSDFGAFVQLSAEQIAALSPAVAADEPMAPERALAADVAPPEPKAVQATPVTATAATTPPQPAVPPSPAQPEHDVDTPEAAAERERIYRELFGVAPNRPGAAGAHADETGSRGHGRSPQHRVPATEFATQFDRPPPTSSDGAGATRLAVQSRRTAAMKAALTGPQPSARVRHRFAPAAISLALDESDAAG